MHLFILDGIGDKRFFAGGGDTELRELGIGKALVMMEEEPPAVGTRNQTERILLGGGFTEGGGVDVEQGALEGGPRLHVFDGARGAAGGDEGTVEEVNILVAVALAHLIDAGKGLATVRLDAGEGVLGEDDMLGGREAGGDAV